MIIFIFLFLVFKNQHLLPLKATFGGWDNFRGVEIFFDFNSLLFIASANIVFFSVLLYSLSLKRDWKYYFLINLLLTNLICLFVANDLFNVYVTLELLSLLSYLLISFQMKTRQIWASLKYMLLGAIGFSFLLLGIALIYNQTGTLNYSVLKTYDNISNLPLILIFTALLIKSGVFLFSMWLPSAHSEAEATISAILSAIIVKAGLFHILRLGNIVNSEFINNYLLTVGIISAVAGAYFAIKQKDLKLILAFSTMSQTGFVLEGWKDFGAYYAFSHSLFKSLLFLSAGYYASLFKSRNITGKKETVPLILYLSLWVGFLSISGIPLFAGSFYKHEIMVHCNVTGHIALVAATLGSVFSISRIIFNLKPSKKIFMHISKDLSLIFLCCVSVIFGFSTGIDHLNIKEISEPLIITLFGFLLYTFLKPVVKLQYPYKIFKLTNVMTIYIFIIGLLATMTYFVF
jgi:multicomponent Na+:H+ antiporter subunit D